jgi:hypothetical protein
MYTHKSRATASVLLTLFATFLAGCVTQKSSHPLAPTVAGPIPGVSISAPVPQVPGGGAKIPVGDQPVSLTFGNATTTGVRPLNYQLDIAADAGFTSSVFSQGNITPGDSQTTVRLPDALGPERTYYWRVRAQDGANTGPYSNVMNFNVFTPIIIGQPVLVAPVGNAVTDGDRPQFVVSNASHSGPVGPIKYEIDVAKNNALSSAAVWTVAEGGSGQTTLTSPIDLDPSTQYFWRSRAFDPTTTGPWSATGVFRTPAPAIVIPPNTGGGGGGGSGANPADAFDLSRASIDGGSPADIASRPVTATITSLDFNSSGVQIGFTKASGSGRWPSVCVFCSPIGSTPGDIDGTIQYTLWLALNVNGVWHTAGIIEYWYGLSRNGGDVTSNNQIPVNWTYYIPAMRYQPAPGEQVGFFVAAGDQRMKDVYAVKERSNVVVIPFPSSPGGHYAF